MREEAGRAAESAEAWAECGGTTGGRDRSPIAPMMARATRKLPMIAGWRFGRLRIMIFNAIRIDMDSRQTVIIVRRIPSSRPNEGASTTGTNRELPIKRISKEEKSRISLCPRYRIFRRTQPITRALTAAWYPGTHRGTPGRNCRIVMRDTQAA